MRKNIGFIGCGNMAQAMIKGIVKSNLLPKEKIMASNPSQGKLDKISKECGISTTHENKKVAESSDILILSVKPYKYIDVINEIKESVKEEVVIVTIAAGIDMYSVEKAFKKEVKIIRTMPNTPAFVGEGMTAICKNNYVNDNDLENVLSIFKSFGKVELLEEKLMDVVPAVSGSSPAYVYMFIEALADGAVLGGIPRDKAYKMAAQTVLGSAKMVLESGKHPGELKDDVCSPGGTTIEAVYALEKNNFRGAIIEAAESCTKKCQEMNKNK